MVYQIALFTHILGVICLMGGRTLIHAGMLIMSRARAMERIRDWAGIYGGLTRSMPVFALAILLAGLYMAWTSWTFNIPWIDASLGVFLVVIALSSTVLRRNFVALSREIRAAQSESVPAPLVARIRDRAMWATEYGISGLLLGIVFLMTVKPDLTGSVLALSIGLLAGVLIGILVTSRLAQAAPGVAATASPR